MLKMFLAVFFIKSQAVSVSLPKITLSVIETFRTNDGTLHYDMQTKHVMLSSQIGVKSCNANCQSQIGNHLYLCWYQHQDQVCWPLQMLKQFQILNLSLIPKSGFSDTIVYSFKLTYLALLGTVQQSSDAGKPLHWSSLPL